MLHANRKYPNTLAPARLIGSRTAICLILARTSMDQGIVVSLENTDTGTNAKLLCRVSKASSGTVLNVRLSGESASLGQMEEVYYERESRAGAAPEKHCTHRS
jgi:hypothetical protein